MASADQAFRLIPPRMENVVNPIGCGDALAAGMAVAIERGADVIEAVRYGMAAAGSVARAAAVAPRSGERRSHRSAYRGRTAVDRGKQKSVSGTSAHASPSTTTTIESILGVILYRRTVSAGITFPASVTVGGRCGWLLPVVGAVRLVAGHVLQQGAVVRQAVVPWPHHEQHPLTANITVKHSNSFHAAFMAHLLASLRH